MATNSQGRIFFLTERHRKLDKISCSLPVLMSTLFLVHYLWRVKSMFISYCCYSFIGQKAKMYITGLKSKCQKACFFFLETSGEKPFFVFSCFQRLLTFLGWWSLSIFETNSGGLVFPMLHGPDLFSLPPPLLRTLVTIKLNGALWDSQAQRSFCPPFLVGRLQLL